MNKTLLVLVLILVFTSVLARQIRGHENERQFKDFTKKHHKKYDSQEETIYRYSVFKENLQTIQNLNNEEPHAVFGLTQFSDLTQDEFLHTYAGAKPESTNSQTTQPVEETNNYIQVTALPASLNLTSSAGNSAVKSQGACGACWAFSACSSIEYSYWKKYGTTVDLSEQQLIDCVSSSTGCNGGWMPNAFQFIKFNLGIAPESSYPYKAVKQTCDTSFRIPKAAKLAMTPYITIAKDDVSIKTALSNYGILSVCVDATKWMYYISGIFSDSRMASTAPICNHGITFVGYGVDPKTNLAIYIAKNNWGAAWGELGYMRMDARRYGNGNTYSGFIPTNIYVPFVQ